MPRAGLTPERIVDVAAQIADRAGLSAVTLARVASKVGVRPPSLYAHVDGLDDLHARLATRGAHSLAAVLAPAAAGRARSDALRSIAEAYRDWALAHPGLYAALQFRAAEDDPATKAVVDLVISAIGGYGIAGDAAIHAARTVRAALHGFIAIETEGGFRIPVDVDVSFTALIATLDAGLGARGAAAADSTGG